MQGLESVIVRCETWRGIVGAVNRASNMLSDEASKQLGAIFSSYLARYDVEGTYERMNNRSVAQIFAELQPEDVREIASGEVDGVRYRLFDGHAGKPAEGTTPGGAK